MTDWRFFWAQIAQAALLLEWIWATAAGESYGEDVDGEVQRYLAVACRLVREGVREMWEGEGTEDAITQSDASLIYDLLCQGVEGARAPRMRFAHFHSIMPRRIAMLPPEDLLLLFTDLRQAQWRFAQTKRALQAAIRRHTEAPA